MGSKKGAGGRAARAEVEGAQLGIDEIRRQFDQTQQNLDPFVQAGIGALPGLQEGATVGGLDATIADILNTDVFGSLVEERQRGVQGQLAAGGLTRSGTAIQEAANIPTELALQLENLLFGRQGQLAGSGQNAASGLGALGAQASGGVADLLKGQGVSTGAGILTNAQAQASGTSQALGIASKIFFSDERLKENIEVIAHIGDLSVIEWDWLPFTKGTAIEKCGTVGFMAQDVEDKYPHHVREYAGWLAIDYPALLDEMEAKFTGRVQLS